MQEFQIRVDGVQQENFIRNAGFRKHSTESAPDAVILICAIGCSYGGADTDENRT